MLASLPFFRNIPPSLNLLDTQILEIFSAVSIKYLVSPNKLSIFVLNKHKELALTMLFGNLFEMSVILRLKIFSEHLFGIPVF